MFSNYSSKTLQNTLKATKSARPVFHLFVNVNIVFTFKALCSLQTPELSVSSDNSLPGDLGLVNVRFSICHKTEEALHTQEIALYIYQIYENALCFKPRSSEKGFQIMQIICELHRESFSIYKRTGARYKI